MAGGPFPFIADFCRGKGGLPKKGRILEILYCSLGKKGEFKMGPKTIYPTLLALPNHDKGHDGSGRSVDENIGIANF